MKKINKVIALILIFLFVSSNCVYGYTRVPEFLCDLGIKLYQQGRYDEALHEFRKALIAQPKYPAALKYIQMIKQVKTGQKQVHELEEEVLFPSVVSPTAPTQAGAIKQILDMVEMQREVIMSRQLDELELFAPLGEEVVALPQSVLAFKKKKSLPIRVFSLEEILEEARLSIEVEQGEKLIIVGKNISRFLVTHPDILGVERKSGNELLVTGKEVGYTYLHVWDDSGRSTAEFLGILPRPEIPLYGESLRKEAERARNFKLRYTLDWYSYESGRRIDSLNRSTYSYSHGLSLTGETPYGHLDSSASIRRQRTSSDLTYFTLGITDGILGNFKDFNLRTFDYSPPFSNLAFSGATLRGVLLTSPAFNKTLDYVTFWGREGGGRYGNLSPGLAETKNSFLGGINFNYSPNNKENYRFTVAHGWGRDRENYLGAYAYDLAANYNFNNWQAGYEVAHDSETFAHLIKTRYVRPKFSLRSEFRNISRNFLNITGDGWRQGELGGLFSLSYTPTDKLFMNSTLDVFRDRLYPAEDDNDRWNEDFNWDLNYQLDSQTTFGLAYALQNELGRVSQYRYQSPSLSMTRRFHFIRDIYTYANYYHQESKNFSSSTSDYVNDKIYLGLRFNLIGDLHYYLNKETSWLEERYTATKRKPNAWETGVDWSGQLSNSPYYGNFRFTYRDEEDAESTLSFLSGEDYIESYGELSYRPDNNKEFYGSCRVRNVWADNPSVSKRFEVAFNAGMRYLWNTGLRWDSVGSIEGYVFKDLNSDGLRQRDEAPIEGMKVWIGKDKSQVTDLFGYYKFKNIKGRKAFVNFDASMIPTGFVLTVPVTQEVLIAQGQTVRVDFGMISRCEIRGLVFEDVDGNGGYSREDIGLEGVGFILDDNIRVLSDSSGSYSFPNVNAGEHTVTLDLETLPIHYLPKAAIKEHITIYEGVTYIYNIPLGKIEE